MKNLIILISIVLIFSFAFAPKLSQDKPWKVPESAQKAKNPIPKNSENINIGKMIYGKHCKSCHGKNGKGDGTKAAELETFPGDFTTAEFKEQTDGTLHYKTAEGRDDMPSFKKKLSDDDIWAVVHYLRSF